MRMNRRMAFEIEVDEGASNKRVRCEAHLECDGMDLSAIGEVLLNCEAFENGRDREFG